MISFLGSDSSAPKPVSAAALKNIHKLPLGISPVIPDFLYLGSGRDAHTSEGMTHFFLLACHNLENFGLFS